MTQLLDGLVQVTYSDNSVFRTPIDALRGHCRHVGNVMAGFPPTTFEIGTARMDPWANF